MTDTRAQHSSATWIALAAVLALAAALRFHHLGNQSLSIDEGLTARLIEYPLSQLIPEMRKIEQLPPLYHAVLHAWVRLPGVGGTRSDAMLRVPSALFGTAAVGMMFLLGRRLFDTPAALAAALLMALSSAQIAYSQNARGYSLFVLLALWSCERFAALFDLPAEKSSKGVIIGLSVSTALMIYTHLFGLTVIAAQACAIAMSRPGARARSALMSWLPAMIIAAVLCLPWVWTVVNRQPADTGIRPAWLPAIDVTQIRRLVLEYAGTWPIAVTFAILATVGLARNMRQRRLGCWLCVSLILTGVIVPLIISWLWRPVFFPRYGLVAQAAILLLAAAGIVAAPRWLISRRLLSESAGSCLSIALALAIIVMSLTSTPRPVVPKRNWRALVADLRNETRPGDVIVMPRWFSTFVFDHYRLRGDALGGLEVIPLDFTEEAELMRRTAGRRVWWVVEVGSSGSTRAPPTAQGQTRVQSHSYDGLELWELAPVPAGR